MTTPSLDKLLKIAKAATSGPWCIESCGEKGDGSNIIGVAFGPNDTNAERPLSGWLEDCDEDGNFIDYYRDEEIAECGHRNRNSGANAAHIAAFNPTVAKALVMGMQVLAEAAQAMHGTGPLSRVDPSDTLDEIGMKAEAALSALTLALKGSNHG